LVSFFFCTFFLFDSFVFLRFSCILILGMFTGDASYSNAYLALGERMAADDSLSLAWTHLDPHFLVFTEMPYLNEASSSTMAKKRRSLHPAKHEGTGTQHFITGAGGYLQNFVFGYPGLRIERTGTVAFVFCGRVQFSLLGVFSFRSERPLLPPFGVTSVRISSLHLLGSAFSLFYNSTNSCLKSTLKGGTPLGAMLLSYFCDD
jgi:hypothetical protein